MTPQHIAIIGGGHAGDEVLAQLREQGFLGTITLLEESWEIPYERPPLSKEFLTQNLDSASLAIRGAQFYQRAGITHRVGVEVVGLELGQTSVRLVLGDGGSMDADTVVLATGMQPRKLAIPGADARGVHYLQTLEEASRLRDALHVARTAVVIGGGFIGAETAASLRTLGKEVALIEHGPRLMARAVSEVVSNFYAETHKAAGVRLLLDCGVDALEVSPEGTVTGVSITGGEVIAAECVLASVGVTPRTELARAVGLDTERGFLVVDERGQSSHPLIYGVGDIALFPHPRGLAERIPIPSLDNASWSGGVVARALVGDESPRPGVIPNFWTEQFGKRTQIAGLLGTRDHSVLRGDPFAGSFSVLHYQQEHLIAVESLNSARDFQAAKKALGLGLNIPADLAAWDDLNLSDFVASLEAK